MPKNYEEQVSGTMFRCGNGYLHKHVHEYSHAQWRVYILYKFRNSDQRMIEYNNISYVRVSIFAYVGAL